MKSSLDEHSGGASDLPRAGRRGPNAETILGAADVGAQSVWPLVPVKELGSTLSREEEDEILGYGPDGF